MSRSRRGAEALEFALTLPILLILVSGLIDFGWYFYQQSRLHDAVRYGARAGAVTLQAEDPLGRAVAATTEHLTAVAVPFEATIDASFVTDGTGDQVVEVHAEAEYVGLWNLVGAPYQLAASVAMRMEEQPEP